MVNQVEEYIAENILHSSAWDTAEPQQKKKAVNQATRTLKRLLPTKYPREIPLEHLSEQAIWLLKIDDMFQRAELGASYINVDGIAINFKQKDLSVCPLIMEVFNLSEGWNLKRKVGRYSTALSDSHRKGW